MSLTHVGLLWLQAAGKPSVAPSGKSFAFGFGARTKVQPDAMQPQVDTSLW